MPRKVEQNEPHRFQINHMGYQLLYILISQVFLPLHESLNIRIYIYHTISFRKQEKHSIYDNWELLFHMVAMITLIE